MQTSYGVFGGYTRKKLEKYTQRRNRAEKKGVRRGAVHTAAAPRCYRDTANHRRSSCPLFGLFESLIRQIIEERTAEAGPSPPPPPQYLEAVGREIEALEEEKERLVEGIEEEEENKGGEWEGINVFWWNRDVDEMGSKELEEYMAALEALRAKAVMKARGY
ncbi:hypothetical protein DM860_005450 [Cuscuta australis]|uniref:MADS-box domain-containing protein n=1 Tax=Cuscuta australis TaxID=267555 RepID=A0A328DZC0_9ASTE|nr:hypothetical protein DM860_005450 [Cuscuta australis]